MKKDAYYFPHFSNARNDAKLIRLRRIMGVEGYGLYFLLLEVLREQTEFKLPLDSLEDLAFEWHTSKEKLMAVVGNFDLFTIDNDMFFSPKLIYYLTPYIEKSEKMRQLALKRWDDANAMRTHMRTQCVRNASKVKESKVNESKVKEKKEKIDKKENRAFLMKNASVSLDDVIEDFYKREDLKNADAEYYYNLALDWSSSKQVKRVDWLATVRNFARRHIAEGKLKLKTNQTRKPWDR